LLSLTENIPKCLLPISGKTIIEWQIDTLLTVGIEDLTIVTGFQSASVEALLQRRYANRARINTIFNPFFEVADNLVSCWLARSVMGSDFLLLNGDTVFDEGVPRQLLSFRSAPITLGVSYKPTYDEDDMKVQLDARGWVKHVSKNLAPDQVDCESIGLIAFRERGPQLFRNAVEEALRHQARLKSWYLTVIDELAGGELVDACTIPHHLWCEIDFPPDIPIAETFLKKRYQDELIQKHLLVTELVGTDQANGIKR
jgi:choline kinase